jgi:hypothetical protein
MTNFIITPLLFVIVILTMLLINSLDLCNKTINAIKRLFKGFTKGTKNNYSTMSDHGVTALKLEAQKISDFNGDFDAWTKWRSRTECAFNGSGYDRILTDKNYSATNPKMNAIVYSQLAVATVDGNAHHLIKQHDKNKDGYEAWNALVEWYDGDVICDNSAIRILNMCGSCKSRCSSQSDNED